jgi:tetratricopeptide (TPR) repeat protein
MIHFLAQSAKNHRMAENNFSAIHTNLVHNGDNMRGTKVADIQTTCQLLIETQQYDRISSVIDLGIRNFNDSKDWNTLLELLRHIPLNIRIESVPLALNFAKALSKTKHSKEFFDFCDVILNRYGIARVAEFEVERSMELYDLHQYREAQSCLEIAIKYLEGEMLGIAYNKLGLVLYALEKPWQEAFQQARLFLSGLELGKSLINEGFCLAQSHQTVQAQSIWQEALVHLQGNLRLQAWVRYNLGITAMRDLNPEAERHFLEGLRLCNNPQAAGLRVAMLNGLGSMRRSLGEWSRAETSYLEALKIARDSYNRKEAHFGLARTLRLSGRPNEALETLEFALQDPTLNQDQIQISRAMTFLALGQNTAARDALSKVGTLVSVSDQWLFKIAQAELLRRDGNLENAVELLEGLPVQTLHAREEARCFPELMQLLYAANKPFPKPLEYTQGITVRVVAQGLLSVRINDRPVNIAPTSRAGELLVYLLEQNGAASIDMISDAMFAHLGIDDRAKARGGIWNLVKTLRGALGWQNSVMALRGAYQLDPNATWQYDMQDARAKRNFQGEFLKGVYSDWVLEIGRTLAGKQDLRRRSSDLN